MRNSIRRFVIPLLAAVLGTVHASEVAGSETTPDASSGEASPSTVTFERDIQPLLTRFGCNSGPCHGKSRGQNGFALSLLGFDSEFDYKAITRQDRGRRVSSASPESSLLLLKAIGHIPHGGGIRFPADSKAYELVRQWIADGTPHTPTDAPTLVRVVLEPAQASIEPDSTVELQVFAEYSDDSRRPVTDASVFQSNDATVAAVNERGILKAGPIPGETAVMARYQNNIAVCAISIPLPGTVPEQEYEKLPRHNKIDDLIWQKLQLLGMLPSEIASEATFHRRAYLRIIGRLPTPDETRAFLADPAQDKRETLIDSLLDRPEYADYWANKWADLLRPNPYRVGIKATWNLDAWLRQAFRENMPYDQFVRELVTATGSTWRNGATVIFRDRPSTVEIGSSVSQLFLGVRLECAKCHHHPFEVWSQDDFFGFAAFFARVGHQGGLSPPISGGEELIYVRRSGTLNHGRTDEPVKPQALLGSPLDIDPNIDPRTLLVDWMTDSTNPFFAHVMANRVWFELMGRGIVDPVDDMRATNPATNQPLLDHLAAVFRDGGYDIKHLIRTIATSHAFQLSSTPLERNATDVNNFSRYYRQRLRAEVLLDGINDVLGATEEFDAMPPGSRAIQLWTFRSESTFLDTFGRPDPNQDPPCDRTTDSTTPQILHLMNGPSVNQKLHDDAGHVSKLAQSDKTNEQIVEEVFLRVYCRPPTHEEIEKVTSHLAAKEDRRTALEDLFWALLNTPEFLFID